MPFILRPEKGKSLEQSYVGKQYPNAKGDTQCVEFILQAVPGVPKSTSAWSEGKKIVKGDTSILPGTAIATFINGKYSTLGSGKQHAAVYLGQDEHGIQVLDQWKGKPGGISVRTISWKPIDPDNLSNNGNAFSVIE